MKVLFLIKSDKTPSSRIRIKDLAPLLQEHGIEPVIEPIPTSFFKKIKLFRKASEYPVVVLQKRLLNLLDFKILRFYSKFLVFDFDDAVYYKNSSPSEKLSDYKSYSRHSKFLRTVTHSDMVIAANNVLSQKVTELSPSKKCTVIPSSVNTYEIPVKTDYSLSSPPVIGWIGTSSTLRYLNYISGSLRKASEKYNFILNVISDKPVGIDGINVNFIQWQEETQFHEISKFDIGIMPLSKDPFSEGKASYKLLQYMAAGIPSVCSDVGMNADVAGNNEFCLKASNPEEFTDHIVKLLQNQELRTQIGIKGRKLVEETYSVQAVASKLAHTLNSIKTNV